MNDNDAPGGPPGLTIDDAHFEEQFPLSPLDDYMIHQTPDPVRIMWTSDPRVYDRHWMVAHDDAGEALIATGGSFYPNLDTAEAWAIVNVGGQHRSVRAFRRLGADRMDMAIGPIRPTIVRGLREWRFVLAENEWGIAYDLTWRDTRRQIYHASETPAASAYPRGRRGDVTAGFEGFGTVEGWVEADGRRIALHADSCHGSRDRHWGVGRGVGGPNLHVGRPMRPGWIGGNWIEFRDFAIWGNIVLYKFGDARPGMGRVVKADRRLKFEPDTHVFLEGVIDYTLDDNSVKQVHFRRLGYQTAYLRCGMYGGTPDKGIFQGQYVGDDVVEGDFFDVTLPENRIRLRGLDQHHCVITCDGETTTGILQPVEPDAYEQCRQGKRGWSLLE